MFGGGRMASAVINGLFRIGRSVEFKDTNCRMENAEGREGELDSGARCEWRYFF